MVSQQTFAAPVVSEAIAATAKVRITNTAQDLRFWWHSSGWEAFVRAHWPFQQSASAAPKGWDGKGAPPRPRPTPEKPEKKQDREVKVARVRIAPGDVTIRTGEQVVFAAIAYDKDGHTISGLDVIWDGLDEDKKVSLSVSPRAFFMSGVPGHYKISATIAGHQAQAKITVEGIERLQSVSSVPGMPVSSRDLPKKTSSLTPGDKRSVQVATAPTVASAKRTLTPRKPLRAAATNLARQPLFQGTGEDTTGWNSANIMTADDPGKERGLMPGHTDDGAGSGNFHFAAPLLGLDGRGTDLELAMHFNSRVWHKTGSEMYFDIDRDWIAGWGLGFGKIVMAGNVYMMIDGDGTRHSFSGIPHGDFPAPYTSLQSYEAYTVDSSFIHYYAEGYKPQFESGGKNVQYAWAKLPDGTTINYGASANYAIYPTQITDANGNYITITYRHNEGPNIETITDTLGRKIHFYYETQGDGSELLTAITTPGLGDGQGNSTPRTVVRLQYSSITLSNAGTNYGFSGVTTHVRKDTIPVIKAIYYPGTNTGFWFGDTDSYSPYGMIRKVSERRGMTFSGPAPNDSGSTGQGTITAGSMSQEVVYNYPTTSGSLTDVPAYTQMTKDWAARDTASAPVTTFSVTEITSGPLVRRTTIVRPDGVQIEEDADNNTISYSYGLVVEQRTYADYTRQKLLHKSTIDWNPNAYLMPRVTGVTVTDERGQVRVTTYEYASVYTNGVTDKKEYAYDFGPMLNRTHTDYLDNTTYNGYLTNQNTLWWHAPGTFYGGPQWSGPHIFNLPSVVEVYASSDNSLRVARTEYQYDQQAASQLLDTPNVVQHTATSDFRGNLTSAKSYANASTLDSSTAVVQTRSYDVCGNVRTISTSCCEQTTLTYTETTKFAWPETTVRGSATNTSQQITTSAVYDLNTGLVKGAYDANGRYSNTSYLTETLRPEYEYAPTGAYTYHIYDDASLIVYDIAYEAGQSLYTWVSRSDKYIDGFGRIHGEVGYGLDYAADVVVTKFDNLGRLSEQTRPYRNGTPANQIPWRTFQYDKLDRLVKIVAPDGSEAQSDYNQHVYNPANGTYTPFDYPSVATSAGGQTVRTTDAWGRQRWVRFDELGRLREVVEPDPAPGSNGSVASNGLLTQYSYDTLDNLTQVSQGDQTRSFRYDALSRLTHQKLAERDATLNDAGSAGSSWSDVFSYDTRNNLIQRIDARRVKTTFSYANQTLGTQDPLNRLQKVSYDKTGAINESTIIAAADVTYGYVTEANKDRRRPVSVTLSDHVGDESYAYDVEGRLIERTQSFAGISNSLVTSYTLDSVDRLTQLTYPTQYGASGLNKKAVYSFDMANRMLGATYGTISSPATVATISDYNAASQTLGLTLGNNLTESYTYDQPTGLLTNQKVKLGATDLLNLSYYYTLGNTLNNDGAKTGQLTKIVDTQNQNRNRTFAYDALSRLSSVSGGSSAPTGAPQWRQKYTYDRYGNRTNVAWDTTGGLTTPSNIPLDGLGALGFTNGQNQTLNNRITTSGYEYDAAGNLTKGKAPDGTWQRYQYDCAGRLIKVTKNADGAEVGNYSTELASYSYGAGNERLIASDNNGAVVTYYAWSGGQVIAEYTKSGTSLVFQKSYVYFGGTLLTTEKSDQSKQYHHPDRLGTRMVTDGSGNVIAENVVLPFGTMLTVGTTLYGDNSYQSTTQTNPSKRFFTSYDRSDTTKLEYAVNRHYNAGQGRFTQVDPQEMGAVDLGDPQTLNLYAYCGNDPINRLDPDGLGILDFLKGLGNFLLGFFGINRYGNFNTPPTFPSGGTGVPGLGGSVFGGGGYGGGGYGSLRTPPFQFASVGAGGVGYLTGLGLGIIGIGAINSFLQQGRRRSLPGFVRRLYMRLPNTLARCINRIFARDNTANRVPQQTINNAPDVDMSYTVAQLGVRAGVGAAAGASFPGDENRGRFGTLSIANNIPSIYSPQLGRTISGEEIRQRTYVHELGNTLSRKYGNGNGRAFGDPNGRVGVSGISDDDTGARLEECVFRNIAP